MRVAALDLGSNTSLLLIAEVESGRLSRVIHDESRVTRMGQGVHANRVLHPEALARLDQCLREYAETIQQNPCDKVIAVATSAARDVSNAQALIEMGKRYQIPIYVIPGTREAELTFVGALCDREETQGIAVIDVGGGSTEVISRNAQGVAGTSVDVGSVRLTELFISKQPVALDEQKQLRDYADAAFARSGVFSQKLQEVVAVAGTPTTLAALDLQREFDEKLVHGYALSLEKIEQWTKKLAELSIEERERLPGMQPKRADVIVAGAIILASALRALGHNQLTVSTRGVRYGTALAWSTF